MYFYITNFTSLLLLQNKKQKFHNNETYNLINLISQMLHLKPIEHISNKKN
jgi:hypothetical protein